MSDGTVWGYGRGDMGSGQIGDGGSSNSFRQVSIGEALTDLRKLSQGPSTVARSILMEA